MHRRMPRPNGKLMETILCADSKYFFTLAVYLACQECGSKRMQTASRHICRARPNTRKIFNFEKLRTKCGRHLAKNARHQHLIFTRSAHPASDLPHHIQRE